MIEYFLKSKASNILKLIPKAQQGYKVQKGDTFNGIALKHGLTSAQLLELNPSIKNPDKINYGITLNVVYPTIKKVQTVEGSKVSNNLNNIDLTPVNISKFDTIVNRNGNKLFVDNNLLTSLDNYLIDKNVGLPLRQAILYSVVQEGSTDKAHGNGAYGYLGWRGIRIPLQGVNQMDYLYDTIFGDFNADHWNRGRNVTGHSVYSTSRGAQQAFINAKDFNSALRALSYGYVRPESSESAFRISTGANYFYQGGKIFKFINHGK